tara:strand:- start:255 stop:611 length:357 start_codon:yes stop_codon:yes gene_type:complete
MKIYVHGGKKHHKDITQKVIEWCVDFFNLTDKIKISVNLSESRKDIDCWGECDEGNNKHEYNIKIVYDQPLRDFMATITHEMVHVKQWETGEWDGDGEKEAEMFQYILADQIWRKVQI